MDVRRGVDIEVKIATKRPSLKFDLLRELERELKNMSTEEDLNGGTPCSQCLKERPKVLKVKPAYPCDSWDGKSHTCWLDRNIGDTVTFVLAFNRGYNPTVQWRQNFHSLHPGKRKFYIIDPDNPLWNIVVGSRGHELRLSPITEIDIDDNSFSAHVIDEKSPPPLHFRIRIMPVDQGFVYPGETLIMNMKRVSLPPTSMTFKWYLESDGEGGTLPSNMKLSPSGGVLTISELRKEQEGVLSCAVYTNLGFFATKQRFLIKEMNQTGNMLLFVPTRPTHFNEIQKRKRRDIDSESDYFDTVDEKNEDVTYGSQNDETQGDRENDFAVDKIDVYGKKDEEANAQVNAFRKELEEHAQSNQDSDMNQQQHLLTKESAFLTPNSTSLRAGELLEDDIYLEVDRKPKKAKMRAQEELSKMISQCRTSFQCSADAHCISNHFCKCNSGFQGNGIFCWEVRREELQ